MRRINELIIHCTATPEGRPVTVEEITEWHKNKGWKTIGYHYVIDLNGMVHNGRPVEQVGAHCEGHNANSIGIVYVGGCDADMKPKDTRNYSQKVAMLKLVRLLKEQYPGVSIHGHNEYAAKACPSFDVQKWRKEAGV
jgi:N-acetylmuramoyl-L-alanine amidase